VSTAAAASASEVRTTSLAAQNVLEGLSRSTTRDGINDLKIPLLKLFAAGILVGYAISLNDASVCTFIGFDHQRDPSNIDTLYQILCSPQDSSKRRCLWPVDG
jgi:hypothetical protein